MTIRFKIVAGPTQPQSRPEGLHSSETDVLNDLKTDIGNGYKRAHILAKENPEELANILVPYTHQEVLKILGLKDPKGQTVAYTLIVCSFDEFHRILEAFPDQLIRILSLEDRHKTEIGERLVTWETEAFRAILNKYPAQVVDILTIKSEVGPSLAYFLASYDGDLLTDVLLNLPVPQTVLDILGLKSIGFEGEQHVGGNLALCNLKACIKILDTYPNHVGKILGMKSPRGTTIGQILSESNTEKFVDILKACSKNGEFPEQAMDILSLKNSKGISVGGYLALRKFLRNPIRDRQSYLFKSSENRLKILQMTSPISNTDRHTSTIAHVIAADSFVNFLEFLEPFEYQQMTSILNLKDFYGVSVGGYFAAFQLDKFVAILDKYPVLVNSSKKALEILQMKAPDSTLTGPNGPPSTHHAYSLNTITIAHILAERKFERLHSILEQFPDQMSSILSLNDSYGVSVGGYIAAFQLNNFVKILDDYPDLVNSSEKALKILQMIAPKGVSIDHMRWITLHGKTMAIKALNATETIAHILAERKSEKLHSILEQFPDQMWSILSLNDSYGVSIGGYFAKCKWKEFEKILDKDTGLVNSPQKALEILQMKAAEGDMIAHLLAKSKHDFLKRILMESQYSDGLDILSLQTDERETVSSVLAQSDLVAFKEILEKYCEQPDAMWHPCANPLPHLLAEYFSDNLVGVLLTYAMSSDAEGAEKVYNILSLFDSKKNTVAGVLLNKDPQKFYNFLKSVPDQVVRILSLENGSCKKTLVCEFATRASSNIQVIVKGFKNQAPGILNIRYKDGKSLVDYLAKHELQMFVDILTSLPDQIVPILSLKNSDGNPVGHDLEHNNYEIFKFILETVPDKVSSSLSQQNRVEDTVVMSILNSPPDEAFGILSSKNIDGNPLAHDLLINDFSNFQFILAIFPNLVMDILSLSDKNGNTTTDILSKHHPQYLDELLT